MQHFRTVCRTEDLPVKISHAAPVFLIGSCFSQHIGNMLQEGKIQTLINPYGVLYNPFSIAKALKEIASCYTYTPSDLHRGQDMYMSLAHHGMFDAENEAACLYAIQTSIHSGHECLKNASHCIITPGTAWVYTHKEKNCIVGNCHKIPQQAFTKHLLSVAEVSKYLLDAMAHIQKINPSIQFIFTVSPVRHLNDGFVENTQSKATLQLAIQAIVKQQANAHYFPAYELLIDDLRDYRFYTSDMVHPNDTAIAYVKESFFAAALNQETIHICEEIAALYKALQHRPLKPESTAYIKFKNSMQKKIQAISEKYSEIDFTDMTAFFPGVENR